MIVLTATYDAIKGDDNPYIGLMLAVSIIVILMFCLLFFIKERKK